MGICSPIVVRYEILIHFIMAFRTKLGTTSKVQCHPKKEISCVEGPVLSRVSTVQGVHYCGQFANVDTFRPALWCPHQGNSTVVAMGRLISSLIHYHLFPLHHIPSIDNTCIWVPTQTFINPIPHEQNYSLLFCMIGVLKTPRYSLRHIYKKEKVGISKITDI